MISILLATIVIGYSVPVDLYYEPYKEKEVPMAVNRHDKRSKGFVLKVEKWNIDHGVCL